MPRYCLPKEHGAKVFELLQVTNDGATMQHRPILLPAENIQVALHDLKKWRVSKQGMPAVLPEATLAKAFPTEHALALEEFQKAQVVVALRECYEKHSCQDQEVLAFATNPQALLPGQPSQPRSCGLCHWGQCRRLRQTRPRRPS